MSQIRNDSKSYDDQVKLNSAINSCHIKWFNKNIKKNSSQTVTGQCAEDKLEGLRVTILPSNMICRRCDEENLNSLYVWHGISRSTGFTKMRVAESAHTWLLKDIKGTKEGEVMESDEMKKLKGVDWLRAIATL